MERPPQKGRSPCETWLRLLDLQPSARSSPRRSEAHLLTGVAKTAILTLRARAEEHVRGDGVFSDPTAADWMGRVDWPIELDPWYGPSAQLALALRADDIDRIVRRYTRMYGGAQDGRREPRLSVVELGCGLSTRRHRLADLGFERWLDVDLAEIIDLRRALGDTGLGSFGQLASSVLDESWMDRVPGPPASQLFIAEGLLYYLPREEVDRLLLGLRRRFPGSAILMDVLGANDHPALLRNTEAAGAPVKWKFEGDFADVLADFGLGLVPDFEPERLLEEATERYWPRFDAKTKGMIYWAMNTELYMRRRSGVVLGRLAAHVLCAAIHAAGAGPGLRTRSARLDVTPVP